MRKYVLSGLVAILLALNLEAGTRSDQVGHLLGLTFGPNPPNPVDVATEHGYYGEEHTVTTPDGYILQIQRIQNKSVRVSEPIVLVHCITCSSAIWMLQEPENNLAFQLADAGYDVWLPTLRGSVFSRGHKQLSTSSSEYWEFGWHEHGVLDMPTIIDHVLLETGYDRVYYIGYSMGTTTFFVMTSMLPEYNAKIKYMVALSPVAYCGNIQSVIRLFGPGITFYDMLMRIFLRNHLPFEVGIIKAVKDSFCTYVSQSVCLFIADSIMGFNPIKNEEVLRTFLQYNPDAASAKQLVHYAQLINSPDTFRMFDYGDENWSKYNSSTPPEYPVDRITVPMTFFYSHNDALAAFEDVESFSRRLKNVTLYPEKYAKYNHLDFVLSATVNEDVNWPLLRMLELQR